MLSTEVLGTIFFKNPDTGLSVEMLVCQDPDTELLFAVEADWLPGSDIVQSPFTADTRLRVLDQETGARPLPVLAVTDRDGFDQEVDEDIDDDDDADFEDDDTDI